jgi:DNA replication and repair protein RecF
VVLKSLKLRDFRSYLEADFSLSPRTAVYGPNGSGKTNLLEAMYMLSVAKSFRAFRDDEVIRKGASAAYIRGEIEDGEDQVTLEVGIEPKRKSAKKNGRKVRLTEILGILPSVLFSPESIEIISGPPKVRRRFLDALLSQADRSYPRTLLAFQKVLRDRNALLERIKSGGAKAVELFFWDKQLIEHGEQLRQKRLLAVESINKEIEAIYRAVSGEKTRLKIVPQFFELSHDLLKEALPRDLELTATTVGPHRDNFWFEINGENLVSFGSRGEWRTTVFALKLSELSYLKKEVKKTPILLLDDVFSELDPERRARLFQTLGEGQAIITTADKALLHDELLASAETITLPYHGSRERSRAIA